MNNSRAKTPPTSSCLRNVGSPTAESLYSRIIRLKIQFLFLEALEVVSEYEVNLTFSLDGYLVYSKMRVSSFFALFYPRCKQT
jgi:hypothetical protein